MGRASDVSYQALRQDPGLYVGEGVAQLSEHGGDPLEAERAALVAARSALAESIEVRISVITTDVLVGGSKAATEQLTSKSRSVSVVELAGVRTRTFTDLPKAGDITVLAYLTKADYRRLLGGRLDDSPHAALDLILSGQLFVDASDFSPALNSSSSAPTLYMPGFELSFGSWALGLSAFTYELKGSNTWDPRELQFNPAPAGGGGNWSGHMQILRAGAGYNWLLGKARWQPYVPLRLECQWLDVSEVASGVYPGVSAGVGLHYWFNNNAALDLRGLWHQGFQGPVTLKDKMDPRGSDFMIFPPQTVSVDLNGPELAVALLLTD
jgi:hypothetical protein